MPVLPPDILCCDHGWLLSLQINIMFWIEKLQAQQIYHFNLQYVMLPISNLS